MAVLCMPLDPVETQRENTKVAGLFDVAMPPRLVASLTPAAVVSCSSSGTTDPLEKCVYD